MFEDELSALHSVEAKITVHEGEMKRCNNEIEKKDQPCCFAFDAQSRIQPCMVSVSLSLVSIPYIIYAYSPTVLLLP